jgi:hypothetical protein
MELFEVRIQSRFGISDVNPSGSAIKTGLLLGVRKLTYICTNMHSAFAGALK